MNSYSVILTVLKAVLPFLIFFGFILFLMVILKKKGQADDSPIELPYVSKKPLTATEAIFYKRLVEALPEYIVLAQVQLCRFIELKDARKLRSEKRSYALQNRIAQQSVDYLICTKDFTILSAIELDDRTHTKATKASDDKKEKSLEAAKVPLVRWHAERMPTIEEVRIEFDIKTVSM
ncbi:MAG: DUF2726 domain-containing protein [Methylophilaceae bacterium]